MNTVRSSFKSVRCSYLTHLRHREKNLYFNLFLIFQPYPVSWLDDYLHVIQFYLEVAMKRMLRMSVLAFLILSALAFSVFGAMAMASTSGTETPAVSAMVTSSLKQEVIGTVTAINATSITLNGAVYSLSAATQIQGAVKAGDIVKLEIVTNADGSITVYEVAKPNPSGSSVDLSGVEPVDTVEPIGTGTVSSGKSDIVEPAHTEIAGPGKSSSTDSSLDKNSADSTPGKGGSSLDKNSTDAGNASGHDAVSNSSQPEPVDASNSPTGDGQ